jgi:hypothetical protein
MCSRRYSRACWVFRTDLTSLDDYSTAFYKNLNFTVYSENLKNPKMLYPLEDILTLMSPISGTTANILSTAVTPGA